MCIVSGDEEDLDNSIRGGAYRTLYSIGVVCGNYILNLVLEFVSAAINHEDWKMRQASMRAFCTVLEGVDTPKMEKAI